MTESFGNTIFKSFTWVLSVNSPTLCLLTKKGSCSFLQLEKDSTIKLNTWNDIEGKETFWHSSAHLLASAISELYPNAKFGKDFLIDISND